MTDFEIIEAITILTGFVILIGFISVLLWKARH